MSSPLNWIRDELHRVSGISDVSIAEFFLDLSSKSSSESDLNDRIAQTETLEVNDPLVREFISGLWSKCPRKGPSEGTKRRLEARAREASAREETSRNAAYEILSDDNESRDHHHKKRKKKKKKAVKDSEEEG
ncbi:Putative premRNAsplicing factor ATPdependent RNA helicase DHX16like, partial [Caligus rogercresseyi]